MSEIFFPMCPIWTICRKINFLTHNKWVGLYLRKIKNIFNEDEDDNLDLLIKLWKVVVHLGGSNVRLNEFEKICENYFVG